MATVHPEALADLARKLARRGENQDATALTPRRATIGYQAVNDRQGKCGSFACSRLSDPQHISSGKRDRNGLALNRRGFVVAFGFERAKDRLGKAVF